MTEATTFLPHSLSIARPMPLIWWHPDDVDYWLKRRLMKPQWNLLAVAAFFPKRCPQLRSAGRGNRTGRHW